MQVWSAVRTNDLDVQSILRAVEAAVATLASLQTERSSPLLGEHVFFDCFFFCSGTMSRFIYVICRECASAYGLTISIHEYCDALWLHAPDI